MNQSNTNAMSIEFFESNANAMSILFIGLMESRLNSDSRTKFCRTFSRIGLFNGYVCDWVLGIG